MKIKLKTGDLVFICSGRYNGTVGRFEYLISDLVRENAVSVEFLWGNGLQEVSMIAGGAWVEVAYLEKITPSKF